MPGTSFLSLRMDSNRPFAASDKFLSEVREYEEIMKDEISKQQEVIAFFGHHILSKAIWKKVEFALQTVDY